MNFKVRDLMIKVLPETVSPRSTGAQTPEAPGCGFCTSCSSCSGCTGCTPCTACTGCTICSRCSNCSGCSSCSSNSCWISTVELSDDLDELAQIRQEIQRISADVDARERALQGVIAPEGARAPRTDAELELLERKLSAALEDIRARLTDLGAARFKVGHDVHGVLRPDKLVAYFGGEGELTRAATALAMALGRTSAHGVPFTSAIDEQGLLSWGVDPPRLEQVLPWFERPSWRLWLTNHIATVLAPLKAKGLSEADQLAFLDRRLRLGGIDPERWRLVGEAAPEEAISPWP